MPRLPQIRGTLMSWRADHYYHDLKFPNGDLRGVNEFVLDPAYQRGSIWTLDQRRALIKSMLMGIPIGAVILNRRGWTKDKIRERVIDGKQRIETLRMFYAGEFTIPAEWVGGNTGEFVKFADIDDRARRDINGTIVPALSMELPTEAQERDVFMLVNFGGTPMTDEDRARAAITRIATTRTIIDDRPYVPPADREETVVEDATKEE